MTNQGGMQNWYDILKLPRHNAQTCTGLKNLGGHAERNTKRIKLKREQKKGKENVLVT